MKAGRRSRSPSASPCCGAPSRCAHISLTQGFISFICENCGQRRVEGLDRRGEVRGPDALAGLRLRLKTALDSVYVAHEELTGTSVAAITLDRVSRMARLWEAVEGIEREYIQMEQFFADVPQVAQVIPLFPEAQS